jgi:hypothetical protein
MLLPIQYRNPREILHIEVVYRGYMARWALWCTGVPIIKLVKLSLSPPGDTHFSKATKKLLGYTQFPHRYDFYFACITRSCESACPLVDEKVSNVDEMASQILGLKSALVIYTWCEQTADTLTTSAPPYPV